MPGRGDNNKNGSSGRGASNQSNQPFGQTGDKRKTDSGEQTGGKRSKPQQQEKDQSANRDRSAGEN
jgi:hypothetical protein